MPEMRERSLYAVQVVRVKADDKADSVLVKAYQPGDAYHLIMPEKISKP
jgi:hypothetical protein